MNNMMEDQQRGAARKSLIEYRQVDDGKRMSEEMNQQINLEVHGTHSKAESQNSGRKSSYDPKEYEDKPREFSPKKKVVNFQNVPLNAMPYRKKSIMQARRYSTKNILKDKPEV